ncbi:MAG: type II CRISPR RNA-guided endonuclease Cas9 [Bacteroidales bacterium]|nr:type II CRISPR RNA-guided endonuclease Cas9 [Bacteroidales bacterium]
MKKIFGLDLGVASIGWAAIMEPTELNETNAILGLGVRINPLTTDEVDEFGKGGNVPTNVARRQARGMRRNLHRYKQRRYTLSNTLKNLGLFPAEKLLRGLSPHELFALRERGLKEPLTREEIGRFILHLNIRRGYKSSRKDSGMDADGKKQSDYLEEIKEREQELHEKHLTIGAKMAKNLRDNPSYRVKQQIFNRSTYQEEFDAVWSEQARYHPDVLTESNRKLIRDRILYFQRPLRSQKGLVGECALEWSCAVDNTGNKIIQPNGLPRIVRPKCAPKSSPLAQECKIWESIHNLRILNEYGESYILSLEQKEHLFNVLQNRDKRLSARDLFREFKLSEKTHSVDALVKEKGLECNTTRARILKVFKETNVQSRDLLVFEPKEEITYWPGTDEERVQLSSNFDQEPFYKLWHLIYATEEESDLIRLLQTRYNFSQEQARALAAIDFTTAGFTNKSSRAMRRLLPHLRKGNDYTASCTLAGYNHSNSLTKAENEARKLLEKLDVLPKNSLRNPVVEKILNQMIHLVNEMIATYGKPDEIRVDLARALKQSAKERKKRDQDNRKREKENKSIRELIASTANIAPESVTKVQIEKWKLYHQVDGCSLYTGKRVDLATFLNGEFIDIEHIIPKTRQFDDSFENKTICERAFNIEKGKFTARDFMEAQPIPGLQSFEAYKLMVKKLLDDEKINRGKFERLMMSAEDISSDFLSRQLRDTQYITKKARSILQEVCFHVHSSSGSVTDFLRHQWGWDEAIEWLRLNQFRDAGLTKWIKIKKDKPNGYQDKEIIPGWTKRLDHRHHALDALVVACTQTAHVHKINNLNKILEGKEGFERRAALLSGGRDKFLAGAAPFLFADVTHALDSILISFKQSNKVATQSKNKPKGTNKAPQTVLTPRGALHKETVYGKIKQYNKIPLTARFDASRLNEVAHDHQRQLLETRIAQFNGDAKKAFKDLDKNPILYGRNNDKILKNITLWDSVLVSRKGIGPMLSEKAVDKIVDRKLREAVQYKLETGGGKSKDAFKSLETGVDYGNLFPAKKARILNNAEKAVQLPRGYVEPGSNHHLAIYADADGKKYEHVVTFWDAFMRRRVGLPAIITEVALAYDHIGGLPGDVPDVLLPDNPDWRFVTSLAINDMFVFGLDPQDVDLTQEENKSIVSKHLFKVRKLTSGNYWFMHHLESQILEDVVSKKMGRCKQCSLSSMNGAVKVKVNKLGKIVFTYPPFI